MGEWKEETGIIGLVSLGFFITYMGLDSGIIAAVITAIAGVAGYKLAKSK
tara:strand:- start:1091 stop:1240 length:150 start_codon:yes stop_codon:yes gene_type:complete